MRLLAGTASPKGGSDLAVRLANAVARDGVLLHGTNRGGIDLFEPRRQTDYRGREVEAVFATDDPIWPLFFAVMKRGVVTATRNMCLRLPRRRRLYYFSVDCNPNEAFIDGFIYLLPRETFVRDSRFLPEWSSKAAVRPLECLEVQPGDFPLADRVFSHRRGESWLRFYARLLAKPTRVSVRA